MNKALAIIVIVVLAACASQKPSSTSAKGNTRTTKVQYLDENTYLLTEQSTEKSYGFYQSNPVKVGSSGGGGPVNERRFLRALLGPNGEELRFARAGSCCPFKTPNGLIENMGMLDQYRVTWEGARDTLTIFINMYDEGDLKIPVGLTARKK